MATLRVSLCGCSPFTCPLAVALLFVACGGRTSSTSAPNSVSPVSLGDAGADEQQSTGDGSAYVFGGAPGFAAACQQFAPTARTSCDGCADAPPCANLQTQFETQCDAAFSCRLTCPCPDCAPGGEDLCACIAGCLPLQDNSCSRLMTQVMQCIASSCAGKC